MGVDTLDLVQLHMTYGWMKDVAGPDLCHCLASRRGARMLSRIYDRHLAPASINISQFALLSYIGRDSGMGASALADRMVMERTTLVRALKPLRAAGLVEAVREGGPDLRYRLSSEGEAVLAEADPLWTAAQTEYETMFGRDRAYGLRDELLALTSA